MELALLLVLVNCDCLMAGVSSMTVPEVDWRSGFLVVMRWVLASVSSSEPSSIFCWGRRLTRLLAVAAFKLAKVGTWLFFPELDFFT